MYLQQSATHVVVLAPAKLNLFLEVRARRADGFHEIETFMAAIDLFDRLQFSQRTDGIIRLECDWVSGLHAQANAARDGQLQLGDLPPEQDNIVVRSLQLLRKRFGCSLGADVVLTKRIPSASGLGGASSDAAAALLAAVRAWRLNCTADDLLSVAAEIGSDVPFFLGLGAARCHGRGEIIEQWPSNLRLHLVLIRPPEGLSTPAVYRCCAPSSNSIGSKDFSRALERGDVAFAAQLMLNGLQTPAETLCSWVGRLQSEFSRQDVWGHQMSGSGSAYFGVCRNRRHARRLTARLRARSVGMALTAATCTGHAMQQAERFMHVA